MRPRIHATPPSRPHRDIRPGYLHELLTSRHSANEVRIVSFANHLVGSFLRVADAQIDWFWSLCGEPWRCADVLVRILVTYDCVAADAVSTPQIWTRE